MRLLLPVLACLTLAACTTTRKIPLNYTPSDRGIAAAPGNARISVGAVNDRRDTPGAPLGTVHSGVGDSTKEIYTAQPLTATVRQFFIDALRNRGLYDPNSPEQLNIDILEFDADQFIRREVDIDLLVALHDARTGYNRAVVPVRVEKMQGGLLNADNLVVGNFPAFQKFVEGALSEAADEGVNRIAPAR
jgi:hypothetical protein